MNSLTQSPNAQRVLPKLVALGLLGLVGSVLPACAGEKNAPSAKPELVAEVAGKPVTMAELEESVGQQLAQLDRQRQQLLEQGLERLVQQKLLEAEAEARGITPEALVEAEISAKVGAVSEAEIAQWYEANKARVGNRPLDQIGPQVRSFLTQQRSAGVLESYVGTLRGKFSARILMDVARVEVAEAGSPAKGPAGAPVVIVEFSDFECPFCGRVNPSIEEAISTYGDQLRVVFRQFPLNIHPRAQKAAEAALCANDQDKFWQMHDALFVDQRKLEVADLKAKASALGLDQAKFDECLDGGKQAARVAADLADGQAAGVTGTPALFINGRVISGAVPFADLAKIIDDELLRKGIQPKKAAKE